MQLVFDARQHALPQRRELWQTALCSAYIALDAELPGTNDYQGSLSRMISVRYRSPTSGCRNT